eukprot:TRINITY_DN7693_c0_g1::TRINITY_DN7693_c0_g1_i1::g.18570::m.18570 TRINITY_DN7693_c0_g1::TRINITY_DN7693_c0_g1_i1::g.18570  ORF type:complete len:121 (+),score=5.32 TRINITY_DN7693_c0_g1_i1:113-475(+)
MQAAAPTVVASSAPSAPTSSSEFSDAVSEIERRIGEISYVALEILDAQTTSGAQSSPDPAARDRLAEKLAAFHAACDFLYLRAEAERRKINNQDQSVAKHPLRVKLDSLMKWEVSLVGKT